ncbi:phosphoethanolamine--lipid A transferase [Psychrobacter frigidicola]|uniref:Phosphoethanolamine--lipid A transferase n=1 Tax=Psychrobacter frigidicola TaxID=45611 RepID=A0A5C7ACD6_9GAMM|nr:phosphoethanolamine--lipid A transferase [Psychrobacter frigidicola]TXD98473.1 phosphoethanolamine--lipid A transferase [Psychrobacter frigidicola]
MNTWLSNLRLSTRQISLDYLIFLTALFLVVTANIEFFQQVLSVYDFKDNIGFILSLGGMVLGILWLVLQLLCYRISYRFVLIFMVIVAALCAYFTDNYGTIFDRDMLLNGMQTDQAEARDLLTLDFIVRLLLLGVLPAVFIYKINVPRLSWKKAIQHKAVTLIMAVALIAVSMLPFGDQYASFFRQHKQVRYYTNPITPVYSAFKLAKVYYDDMTEPTSITAHAIDTKKITPANSEPKPKLMVFVVGETVRSDHISLNGYPRDTMPLLGKQENIYSFKEAMACGTSTAYSVPCMFSYLDQSAYDVNNAKYHDNVLDTLSRLGVKVVWRDNNSSSKGVANRVIYEDFKTDALNPVCDEECRDVGMLSGFDQLVSTSGKPQDTLLILHQMGNHGPAYYKRYPKEFEIFKPVCRSNELSECDSKSLINSYDNAIRYTDLFLNTTIETLKKHQQFYDVVMVYMSDHGESLGEKNIYLHGLPYKIAPKAQKQVPLIVWSPENNGIDSDALRALLTKPISHDVVTPSLLSFYNIETQETADKLTLFETK